MLHLHYGRKFFYYFSGLAFFFCAHSYSMDLQTRQSVEDKLSQLTLDEKIGQLFMVSTVADPEFLQGTAFGIDPATYQQINKGYIEYLIKNYHIGGIIFQ